MLVPELSGRGVLRVCAFAALMGAINKIYVNRSLIVLQRGAFDEAEREETCRRWEDAAATAGQRSPLQPDIWSPFQAATVAHNGSLLFIFWVGGGTLVMSLLLLSPQDNSCRLSIKTHTHTPHHHHPTQPVFA